MDPVKQTIKRPVALVILDGWGYAPRTEGNAIAIAHTPYYDEICRKYPMTTLSATLRSDGGAEAQAGSPEIGHLNVGTGRPARTESARIREAVTSGEFFKNKVLDRAFDKAKANGAAVHFVGLLSDGGVHSSIENLFALLRLAKQKEIENVFIHGILDGLDAPERTADVYVEALEIKLADIGVGRVATLCGRFFAMDSTQNWERTARAFTLMVHAEGERTGDAVAAIRNSFLRGISDEFIAPIVVERAPDVPVATVRNGDLIVFFNHRADGISQLVRSLCVAEGASGAKPGVDTVCLTEYDRAFNLPVAFSRKPEKNTLTEVLSAHAVPNTKITELARHPHLTNFFDGGADAPHQFEQELILGSSDSLVEIGPESQSFKIADQLRRSIESSPTGFFVVNLPAAGLMAETGDIGRTISAIQYVDTCLGGICEKVAEYGGAVVVTSTYGNCERMLTPETGETDPMPTANPVPFHYIDDSVKGVRLSAGMSLADVAPTILAILDIEKPPEMTGTDLRSII
jgi:2,3-bisphosphoglycerate-independent phosphoglycerate mutase